MYLSLDKRGWAMDKRTNRDGRGFQLDGNVELRATVKERRNGCK